MKGPESRSHVSLAAVAALVTTLGAAGCGQGTPDKETSQDEARALATASEIKPRDDDRIIKVVSDYNDQVGGVCGVLIARLGEDGQEGVKYKITSSDQGGAVGPTQLTPEKAVACGSGLRLDEADSRATTKAVGLLARTHKDTRTDGNFEFCVQTPPERAMFETSEATAFVSAVQVTPGECVPAFKTKAPATMDEATDAARSLPPDGYTGYQKVGD